MTSRYKYVQYDDGSRELFDLQRRSARTAEPRRRAGLRLDDRRAPLEARIARGRPDVDTTIVTGPWPARDGPSRSAAFTFFSPSRFSTYRCRLTHDGVADPWHACDGSPPRSGNLADGDYTFEVAGIDEAGHVDATPASRSFTIASSGPPVSIGAHPPAAQASGDASFSFSSPVANADVRVPVVAPRRRRARSGSRAPGPPSYTDLADGDVELRGPRARHRGPRRGPLPLPAGSSASTARARRSCSAQRTGRTSPRRTTRRLRFVPTEGVAGRDPRAGWTVAGRRTAADGTFSVIGLAQGRAHGARHGVGRARQHRRDARSRGRSTSARRKVRIAKGPERFTSDRRRDVPACRRRAIPSLFLCRLDGLPEMPCDDDVSFGPLAEGPHALHGVGAGRGDEPSGSRSSTDGPWTRSRRACC